MIAEDSVASVKVGLNTDIERAGWQEVYVQDGEDALRLLKIRNWDAVMLGRNVAVKWCSMRRSVPLVGKGKFPARRLVMRNGRLERGWVWRLLLVLSIN